MRERNKTQMSSSLLTVVQTNMAMKWIAMDNKENLNLHIQNLPLGALFKLSLKLSDMQVELNQHK